jgi:CRP-like cAMP-binding protein
VVNQSADAGNYLLATLPPGDRRLVTEACERVELPFGEVLGEPGDTIHHAYFPTDSYISLITPSGTSESLEVGMVGSEGVFGATLMLGINKSGLLGLVQGGGPALRMSATRFRLLAEKSKPFRRALNRYLFVLTAGLAQTAACSRFHLVDARTARWLLMTHDRAHRDTFRLTHNFLAYMLGVRRAGVTEAAGHLQARGLIRYSRGQVAVIDRAGLEALSCPCYDILNKTYREYLGAPVRRAAARSGSKRK